MLTSTFDPSDIRGYVGAQAVDKGGAFLSPRSLTIGSSVVVEVAARGDIDAIGKALGATSRRSVAGGS